MFSAHRDTFPEMRLNICAPSNPGHPGPAACCLVTIARPGPASAAHGGDVIISNTSGARSSLPRSSAAGVRDTMASVGVAAGRQAEDTLPPPAEPPLPEMKPLPQPQPPPSVSAQQPQPAPKPPSPAGVKAEENCSFLPLVHSIIKCMDKDSPDIHQDLNTLKAKFQEMRKVVSTMPGIHLSPEQQQQQLQRLREQVRTKNELLQKYKSLCMFEIPKE